MAGRRRPSRRRSARCFAGAGAAAALALMRRFPRALVAARQRRSPSASRRPRIYLGPVVLDPIFNRFTPLPEGRTRARRARRSPARRASTSARSTRSTRAGARRPPTPTSPGWGATKRVVLYDTLLQRLHPRRGPPRRRPRARPRALPRRAARAALRRARGARRRSTPPRCSRAAWRRPSRRPGPAALPALALSIAVVSIGVDVVANQLSRRDRGARRQLLAAPDRRARAVHRLRARHRGPERRRPRPARAGCRAAGTHPPTVERIGIAKAYEAGAR